ncbi:YrrS family protein [Salsuginibacillus halophilus]|nr:YrrS family protein [Salsuginibacillus halophilus]
MSEYQDDSRYDMRKQRKMNRLMNAAIAVVAALILFFAAQLFIFNGEDQVTEEDDSEETEELEESEDDETEEEASEEADEEDSSGPEEAPDETNRDEDEDRIDEETDEDQSEIRDEDEDEVEQEEEETERPEDGEYEPIGTAQTGSFQHDFNRDSVNWAEMEEALSYATGLSQEEMVIWHLGNGGAPDRAEGYVSLAENEDRPYRVLMEFVEGEGWKPIEVEENANR